MFLFIWRKDTCYEWQRCRCALFESNHKDLYLCSVVVVPITVAGSMLAPFIIGFWHPSVVYQPPIAITSSSSALPHRKPSTSLPDNSTFHCRYSHTIKAGPGWMDRV
ncbi:hypothetical protein EX30DRAFT_190140 [Ascodesmis nigricans]|uniref:Uncharacterized protein n=1 Tax=Ascodesmis nigricans TaxID=341454 RepID=A0A4S2N0E9_9PEZI|nr:hypothetical protein EX30DRAFT_190140 [Ascodesmis nigricans]